MIEPNLSAGNRYLYHWIAPERLSRFAERGMLKPYWRHWIYELGSFERGISTAPNPMQWMPLEEEGQAGEPCIVIDRNAFRHRSVELCSGETYHLTRDVLRAMKSGRDVEEVTSRVPDRRKMTWSRCDETFILDPIPSCAVVAIGYEPERMYWEDLQIIRAAAERWQVPLMRMDGWLDNPPASDELDDIVECIVSGETRSEQP